MLAVLDRGYSTQNQFCEKTAFGGTYMKNVILSIAVAFALVAAFIYGVEFGRKVEHESVMNAEIKASTASVSDNGIDIPTYSYDYAPDSSGDEAYYTPKE